MVIQLSEWRRAKMIVCQLVSIQLHLFRTLRGTAGTVCQLRKRPSTMGFTVAMMLMKWYRMKINRTSWQVKDPKMPPFQSSTKTNRSMMSRWKVWIWEGWENRNRFRLTNYPTGLLKTYLMRRRQRAQWKKGVSQEVRSLRLRPKVLIQFNNRILI